jgi:hypothetical protein
MLSQLFILTLSQSLPNRTAIVFAGEFVNLQTPDGPRLVYGAYFPFATDISLTDSTTSLNASLTFPDYCSAIGISNQPNYNFFFPLSSGIPERPFVNVCIWFHSTPANVSYSYRSVTNNTLQLEQIDGEEIDPPVTIEPNNGFAFQSDVLLRWLILSPEESSWLQPSLRIEPEPGYPPEKTFSTFFVVNDSVTYFDPAAVTDTPPPTETPLATERPSTTETESETPTPFSAVTRTPRVTVTPRPSGSGVAAKTVGLVAIGVVAVLAVAGVIFVAYRWYMKRRGGRPERKQQLPSEEETPLTGLAMGDVEVQP